AGIPPFNGFLSKELFLEAMFSISEADFSVLADVSVLFPILAIVGSIFTLVYSVILIRGIFLGKTQPQTPKEPREAPPLMLISPIFLTVLVIVFGLFPNMLSGTIIDPAAMGILNTTEPLNTEISHWHGWDSPALWATVAIVVIGALMCLFRNTWMPVFSLGSKTFTLNHLYDHGLLYIILGEEIITDIYMRDCRHSRHRCIDVFIQKYVDAGVQARQQNIHDQSFIRSGADIQQTRRRKNHGRIHERLYPFISGLYFRRICRTCRHHHDQYGYDLRLGYRLGDHHSGSCNHADHSRCTHHHSGHLIKDGIDHHVKCHRVLPVTAVCISPCGGPCIDTACG